MPEAPTALLEARLRPIIRASGISPRVAEVDETLVAEELPGNPLGVFFPVGGDVDHALRRQCLYQQITKACVDDTSLVMPLLVPGIRKEQQHALDRMRWNHVLQHFHRIVFDQANIIECAFVYAVQAAADTRLVHFDPDIDALGIKAGHMQLCIAVADADLEATAIKFTRQNNRLRAIVNTIYRPVAVQRLSLRGCNPAGATNKTADAAFIRGVSGHIVTRISSLRALISALAGAKYRLSVLFYILS